MQPAKLALNAAVEAALRKKGKDMAKIVLAWSNLLPGVLAQKCWPYQLRSYKIEGRKVQTLHVHTQDASAGLALTYQEPLVLEKMILYFGQRLVDRISVKTVGNMIP